MFLNSAQKREIQRIMTEHGMLFLALLILYILLMIINYRAFTKYPEKLTEGSLGGSLLESRGPAWFIVIKMIGAFVVICIVVVPLTMFLPTRYSYLVWGILLGGVFFNVIRDYVTYRRVAEREQKG